MSQILQICILQICISHSSAGTNFFNDKTETLLVKNLGTKVENGVKYFSLLKRVSLYIISAFHSPDVQESIVEERSGKWNREMMYRNHFLSGKKQGTNFFHFLCLRPCMLPNALWGRCFTLTSFAPPSLPIGLFKTELGFIVRSVETGLGIWTLVLAVICVDAYLFLAFSDLTCHLADTGIALFWLHCAAW